MSWPNNTRNKVSNLGAKSKGTANPLTWDLPRAGLLQGIFLAISGSVAGSLSAPNALGMSSIVRSVRLVANSGLEIFRASGPGYAYLLRDSIEANFDTAPQNTGRVAVTATTFNLDMYIPVAINSRDPLGLIMLQNESTLLTLTVEFEADATVATGATVTATVTPFMVWFTAPQDPKDLPAEGMSFLHTITEETLTVSGAGDVSFYWPRGNTYAQLIHGLGFAVSAADSWSSMKVFANQSDTLYDLTPAGLTGLFNLYHGRARPLGVIPVDLLQLSGLGNYGSARDVINTARLTDIRTVITATGAGTLYSVKRQLVPLTSAG